MTKPAKQDNMLTDYGLDELIGGNLDYFDALANAFISSPGLQELDLLKTIVSKKPDFYHKCKNDDI